MNAIEFVKKHGIELVKRDVYAWKNGFIEREDFLENYGFDILDDLKQIVDAFELVESYGSIKQAKYFLSICADWIKPSLEQAINLVEQCQ